MKRLSLKVKIALAALLVVVALAGVAMGSYLYVESRKTDEAKELSEEVAAFQEELRITLIQNCNRNANPLREILQNRIKREIKEDLDPDQRALIERAFVNLTSEEIEELIDKSLKTLHEEKLQLEPVNCKLLYPKPKDTQ